MCLAELLSCAVNVGGILLFSQAFKELALLIEFSLQIQFLLSHSPKWTSSCL